MPIERYLVRNVYRTARQRHWRCVRRERDPFSYGASRHWCSRGDPDGSDHPPPIGTLAPSGRRRRRIHAPTWSAPPRLDDALAKWPRALHIAARTRP
jgi:hypothetical protein